MKKGYVLFLFFTLGILSLPEKSFCTVDFNQIKNSEGYREKDVEVKTGSFILPGTLTLPEGEGKFPVVILVHGSGPADRDEAGGPHRPFYDLAHGLALHGIASIRYDKRTYVYKKKAVMEGKALTPEEEIVEDVLSAVKLAKLEKSVDAKKIYVLGHSQGGMMLPLIMSRAKNIAGGIIFSAPSRRLEDTFGSQLLYMLEMTPQAKDSARIEGIRQITLNTKRAGATTYDPQVGLLRNLPLEYWAYMNQYDHLEMARRLKRPLLIMQGERDYQVTREDFEGWQKGLAGKKKVTFRLYPKLNHLYIEGEGLSTPLEYLRPGKMAPYVIKDIADWVLTH